jgi:DNA-3-methyladenine glycosylase I
LSRKIGEAVSEKQKAQIKALKAKAPREKNSYTEIDGIKRCWWCGDDPEYMAYHDKEWGVPIYDNQKLFELLNLEGAQAGLSWITILRKREGYRKAFANFDPDIIAQYDQTKIDALLQNPEIVRNKLKVNGVVTNAKLYIEMREAGEDFSEYLWGFVNGKTIKNKLTDRSEICSTTPESDAMSKDLKKRGFKFVGSTICYAFMQSAGMVNDHLVDCHRYKQC